VRTSPSFNRKRRYQPLTDPGGGGYNFRTRGYTDEVSYFVNAGNHLFSAFWVTGPVMRFFPAGEPDIERAVGFGVGEGVEYVTVGGQDSVQLDETLQRFVRLLSSAARKKCPGWRRLCLCSKPGILTRLGLLSSTRRTVEKLLPSAEIRSRLELSGMGLTRRPSRRPQKRDAVEHDCFRRTGNAECQPAAPESARS
jgi:hypothetical protein